MSRLPPKDIEEILEIEIATLALSESELIARVRDLESERTAYRELAVAALENVAQLTHRNRMLAVRIDDLNRALRGLFVESKAERAA